MPRARARSMPSAFSRWLMTTEISASGMRPEATLCARASKFEPRPESRMPMRFFHGRKKLAQFRRRANYSHVIDSVALVSAFLAANFHDKEVAHEAHPDSFRVCFDFLSGSAREFVGPATGREPCVRGKSQNHDT